MWVWPKIIHPPNGSLNNKYHQNICDAFHSILGLFAVKRLHVFFCVFFWKRFLWVEIEHLAWIDEPWKKGSYRYRSRCFNIFLTLSNLTCFVPRIFTLRFSQEKCQETFSLICLESTWDIVQQRHQTYPNDIVPRSNFHKFGIYGFIQFSWVH